MKTYTRHLLLLPALIAGLGEISAGRLTAQTFTTLYDFAGIANGAVPTGLIVSNNNAYGTTGGGGSGGSGSVFVINTDGTGFTNLHSFARSSSPGPFLNDTNSDGVGPKGLVVSGNTLYGAASGGGNPGSGTVFALNTDGTGFTNLYVFTISLPFLDWTNSDGARPNGLIISGNTLYGTASFGGSSGKGTVFKVNTDGTGFMNLHSFTELPPPYYSTNSDGATPLADLLLSGDNLYGTAAFGGSSGNGTVFKVNTDGTGFTNLHSFTATLGPNYTNSDGAQPEARLLLSGNTLYGTAVNGGSSAVGTVFAMNTDGTGFTNLHSFTAFSSLTDFDGAHPYAGLILSGNTLHGTASGGGSSGEGTVFAVNTDGTGFTNLHNFTRSGDGANPRAGLILSGNTLYGTAGYGGSSGIGTVFSLSFRPQLTIIPSGTNVVLSWPLSDVGFSYAGYILEDAATLGKPTGWSAADTNVPVIVNGQLRVTRPMLGPQWSFRLAQ